MPGKAVVLKGPEAVRSENLKLARDRQIDKPDARCVTKMPIVAGRGSSYRRSEWGRQSASQEKSSIHSELLCQIPHRIIEGMARFDIHLKVQMDIKADEQPEKLAGELCRQLLKLYGVRSAEMVNYVQDE